jgi:uncharacterized protein YjbJ (UPF0337 family)
MGHRAGARVHPAPGAPAALLTITDTQPHDPTARPAPLRARRRAHTSGPHRPDRRLPAQRPTSDCRHHETRPHGHHERPRPATQQTNPTTHEKPRLKGQIKEATGRATGNRRLEDKGRADQTRANLKQAAEKVKDAFRPKR